MINEVLIERLSRVEGLVAAYLSGSRARGDSTSASDVDVAVWLTDDAAELDALQLELAADLEQRLGTSVDVVVLNRAPSDLTHRVLRDGIILLERDRSARVRFGVRARNDYFDLLPVRNEYRYGRRSPHT